MGASTPHFALQLRNRIAHLISDLPAEHPARLEGEREIARLERLGLDGETRGEGGGHGRAPDALAQRRLSPSPSAQTSRTPRRAERRSEPNAPEPADDAGHAPRPGLYTVSELRAG